MLLASSTHLVGIYTPGGYADESMALAYTELYSHCAPKRKKLEYGAEINSWIVATGQRYSSNKHITVLHTKVEARQHLALY